MAKAMTKSEIADAMAQKMNMTKKDAGMFIEEYLMLAIKKTKADGEFAMHGIGKLVKAKRKARKGRNPQTGEEIQIPAKTVVKFRVAKAAKDAIM